MHMSPIVNSWLDLSREQLDEIYRNAEAGSMPSGDMRGTAILAGSMFSRIVATFARLFAWQGKVFDMFTKDGEAGILVNKVSPFSLTFIVAKVYRQPS